MKVLKSSSVEVRDESKKPAIRVGTVVTGPVSAQVPHNDSSKPEPFFQS